MWYTIGWTAKITIQGIASGIGLDASRFWLLSCVCEQWITGPRWDQSTSAEYGLFSDNGRRTRRRRSLGKRLRKDCLSCGLVLLLKLTKISPPSASKNLDYRQIQTLVSEYSEFLNRILNGPQGGLDLKSLCIVPGSLHWVITADILILEYGGNVLDTLFAAVRGALYNTRIPKVSVESSEGHFEFDVAEEETEFLQGRERIPVCVTLNTVSFFDSEFTFQIGNRYIVDASPIEELCSDAGLSLCFNPDGHICAIKKRGNGGIEPSLMNAILQAGKPFAQQLLKDMTHALQREEMRIETDITTSRQVVLPR